MMKIFRSSIGRMLMLMVVILPPLAGCAVEVGTRMTDPPATPAERAATPTTSQADTETRRTPRLFQRAATEDAPGDNAPSDNETRTRRSAREFFTPLLEASTDGVNAIQTQFSGLIQRIPQTLDQASSTQQIVLIVSVIATAILLAVVFSAILI